MKASLIFYSGSFEPITRTFDGFKSIDDAERFGYQEATRISAATGEPWHLGNVNGENGDFACIAFPEYWQAEGIRSIRDDSLTPRPDAREHYDESDTQSFQR